jgi:cytochrome d ubiquinol oxidase subunit I
VIAVFDWLAWRTRQPRWREAARFYTAPFLVNFVCGLATGYPLRLQIQQHWAGYAEAVGQVFSAVFAFEGGLAPVLLGTVLLFALRERLLPPLGRWLVSTLLAVLLIVQSSAILMLNAWMQKPMGIEFVDGVARFSGFSALINNPLVLPKVMHTVAGAWVLGGMFVVGISAWFMLRRPQIEMARGCLKVASWFVLAALALTGAAGHWSGALLVEHQPMKLAAIEAIWRTEHHSADLVLVATPDQRLQTNTHAIKVPGALSWVLGTGTAPVQGLVELSTETAEQIREELIAQRLGPTPSHSAARMGHAALLDHADQGASEAHIDSTAKAAMPPVALVFWSFRVMLFVWAALLVLMLALVWHTPEAATRGGRRMLATCLLSLPLAWVAIEAGWIVCEVGRQPWAVTGLLPTKQGIGSVGREVAQLHLVIAGLLGVLMLAANVTWLLSHVRRGPRALRALPWRRAASASRAA